MTNLITQKIPTKTNLLPLCSVSNKKLKKPPTTKSVTSNSTIKLTSQNNLNRAISKQSELIQLMKRPEGIALSELMKLTNWQAHSIRGWISGTLRKKLGLGLNIKVKSIAVYQQLHERLLGPHGMDQCSLELRNEETFSFQLWGSSQLYSLCNLHT